MIYDLPAAEQPVDQGDVIDGCPILQLVQFDPQNATAPQVACSLSRVVVLTQTCDLANRRTRHLTVAIVHNAQLLVDQNIIKAADVRGPIRAARVYGWYFLPADPDLKLDEAIVDLRQLHTIPLEVIETLCKLGGRKARIQSPYREHLAKHFADTYSRIGLPLPYETL
jgi:hypothetical protein